ncbi:MAG TPA: methyltransferase, partial [Candidatus Methanoperedens sp.]
MTFLSSIRKKAENNRARIGLGIGNITEGLIDSIKDAGAYARVVPVGTEELIRSTGLEFISSAEPSRTLVEMLLRGEIDGAVRGTLSATKTLSFLKQSTGKIKLCRIALLETADGIPFFLAPVGIDEGSSVADKIVLIKQGVKYIEKLGIDVKVGILSGGRFEDKGRDETVDRTLKE